MSPLPTLFFIAGGLAVVVAWALYSDRDKRRLPALLFCFGVYSMMVAYFALLRYAVRSIVP